MSFSSDTRILISTKYSVCWIRVVTVHPSVIIPFRTVNIRTRSLFKETFHSRLENNRATHNKFLRTYCENKISHKTKVVVYSLNLYFAVVRYSPKNLLCDHILIYLLIIKLSCQRVFKSQIRAFLMQHLKFHYFV